MRRRGFCERWACLPLSERVDVQWTSRGAGANLDPVPRSREPVLCWRGGLVSALLPPEFELLHPSFISQRQKFRVGDRQLIQCCPNSSPAGGFVRVTADAKVLPVSAPALSGEEGAPKPANGACGICSTSRHDPQVFSGFLPLQVSTPDHVDHGEPA